VCVWGGCSRACPMRLCTSLHACILPHWLRFLLFLFIQHNTSFFFDCFGFSRF
jgi:hypothetical protein